MDQARMRQRLLQERQLLEEQIKRIEDWGLGEKESWLVGELSSYDQHPADQGSETFEREKDIALRDHARIRLQRVNEALESLDAGEYGICSRCGRKIDEERLEAIPFTNLCFECKKAEEEEFLDDEIRPVEEQVVHPSYSFRDNKDEYVGFDGEDAWQAVARYGTANTPQDVPDSIELDEVYIDADEDVGLVDAMDGLVDVRGNGASDFEAIYPDPLDNPTRKRQR